MRQAWLTSGVEVWDYILEAPCCQAHRTETMLQGWKQTQNTQDGDSCADSEHANDTMMDRNNTEDTNILKIMYLNHLPV